MKLLSVILMGSGIAIVALCRVYHFAFMPSATEMEAVWAQWPIYALGVVMVLSAVYTENT